MSRPLPSCRSHIAQPTKSGLREMARSYACPLWLRGRHAAPTALCRAFLGKADLVNRRVRGLARPPDRFRLRGLRTVIDPQRKATGGAAGALERIEQRFDHAIAALL